MKETNTAKTYASLREAVEDCFGASARITHTEHLHGGDISDAFRVRLSTGDLLFLKTNALSRRDLFLTEAAGLQALGTPGEIGVPRVLGTGTDPEQGISFLALEYLDGAPPVPSYWEIFGHQLAALHRADCHLFTPSGKYGFSMDNYIGSSPQKNIPSETWTDFYRNCRLQPQFAMAWHYLDDSARKSAEYLLEHLDAFLREPEFSSLLHGDLWSGNVLRGPDGLAWLIDPAACVGDFEADLAMTRLFGGFPESFYAAYREINPPDPCGLDQRRDLYQLYHLLNHLNLFGAAYLGSVLDILRRYGR